MPSFGTKEKFGLLICLGLAGFLGFPNNALAQYYSQNGVAQEIVVDKQVRPIEDEVFYDNIGPDKKVFSVGEQLEFKIKVKNSGNVTLDKVKIKDSLPNYLTLLFYPGVFNKTDNTITTEIDTLEPGQSKEFFIRAYVDNTPISSVIGKRFLQINKVTASNEKVSDNDQSQYYISARMVPVTGADDLGWKTLMVVMVTISSIGLRKFARGY